MIITPEMEKLLYQTANEVIHEEQPDMDPEISLLLVDDGAIQVLNRDYRGIDRPTDVLSFAMEDEREDMPEFLSQRIIIYWGIVISLKLPKRQAEEYGHSLEEKFVFDGPWDVAFAGL